MSRKIEVKCPHCGRVNSFDESELVSEMPLKNDEGSIVEEYPPVEVDENTFIKCESCGYPVSCANAKFSDVD